MTSSPKWSWGLRAVALASLLCVSQAQALSLGKVSVLSALGEPLIAEIDVPQISTDEEASLKVGVASSDTFKAAGVDFNAALIGAEIKLRRRSNGRVFLRLESNRTVNEPFLDLILEANWASGRIVRDYTLLLDPPNTRNPVSPLSASISDPSVASRQAQKPALPAPVLPAQATPPVPSVADTPKKQSAPVPAPPPVSSSDAGTSNVTVTTKPGDTAVKLASSHQPPQASLDQMLVAMLRANPQAFVNGNVNRLRAGATLEIPNATAVSAVSNKEAREILATQSRDFSEFRRRLAGMTTAAPAAPVERQVTGKINEVKVKSANNTSPDKLTLSKPEAKSTQVAPTKEDDIAKDLQVKDANARKEELAKNIADLTQIATTAALPKASNAPAPAPAAVPVAPAAPVATGPAPAPAVVVPTPIAPPAAVSPAASANEPAPPAAVTPTTAALPAEGTQNTTSAAVSPADAPPSPPSNTAPTQTPPTPTPPAAEPPKPKPELPPLAQEEPSFIDSLTEEPWVLPAGGVLLAGVLGAVAWRIRSRQRQKGVVADSSFLESRLQPDSFFGASGGQNVDTAEAGSPAASSMMYSPSQLDAGGDVDPVAEADVYLAYGRDLQAEEILKEALRTDPQRVAIHCKLLDIYAKRHDVKAFEVLAYEVYSLTQGMGPEWEGVCELGRELAPENTLYRPGGTPQTGMSSPSSMLQTQPHHLAAVQSFVPQQEVSAPDLDLDLDFSDESFDQVPAGAPTPPNALYQQSARAEQAEHSDSLSFTTTSADSRLSAFGQVDFSTAPPPLPSVPPLAPGEKISAHRVHQIEPFATPATSQSPAPVSVQHSDQTLDFDANDLEFSLDDHFPEDSSPAAPPQAVSAKDDLSFEMLEFDIEELSRPASKTNPNPALVGAPTGPGDLMDMEMLGAEVIHAADDDDPLETKLSLAAEFLAIGDNDAARSLAEEVVEQATGALKKKASKFLSDMA
ncbi:MAG: FimV N-terminal domain [Pseudomonadota bacterium]|jgi:pilus assembly protein FimV